MTPTRLGDKLLSFASQIEQGTIDQARETASMPFVHPHVALMPDAHSGKGSAVGTVIPTKGAVIPAAVGVDIGCVDADTEYLTPTGWKKISHYIHGDLVMQYEPGTGIGEFVMPQRYIVRDQETFYHLKTKYGIDQMLTPDHKMLLWEIVGRQRDRVLRVVSAEEFVERHHSLKLGFGAEIETSFRLPVNYGIRWNPATARVQVMTSADAHIDDQGMAVLHLSKTRKVERAEKLLRGAGVEYTLRPQSDDTVNIRYRPPLAKGLEWFWGADSETLTVVADEVLHWDGNTTDQVFFTRREDEADLVQYAFTASGFRSTKRADVHYRDGQLDYRVFRHAKTRIGMKSSPRTDIEVVHVPDSKAYCFTVPSGFLVMRRNGQIFMTGNCGMVAVKTRFKWDEVVVSGARDPNLPTLREAIEDAIPLSPGNYNKDNHRFPFTRAKHEELIQLANRLDVDLSHSPKWMEQLGSLGGGNHFVETCTDAEDWIWLFLHSGSRGVGNKIAQKHIKVAVAEYEARMAYAGSMRQHYQLPNKDLAYLTEGTPTFDRYIKDLEWAQRFAYLNRAEMMDRYVQVFADWLGVQAQRVEVERINCHHNYTVPTEIQGERVWLTRKGAIDASEGKLGVIPGSMGSASYVVRGKGSPTGLSSAPHGAGRQYSRTQAKKLFTEADLEKAMEGIEYRHGPQWIDEIPGAYKDISQVIADSADLIEVVTTLKQVLNVKGT